MLDFSDRVGAVLRLLLDLVGEPCMGLRIAPSDSSAGELRVERQTTLDSADALLLAPEGVLLFIDPILIPFVNGAVLDGTFTSNGKPMLVLHRERSQRARRREPAK